MNPPFKVGDILRIAEPDYAYGLGPLVLRLTELPPPIASAQEWVYIRGIQLAWNGQDKREREVLVRVAALRRAVQPG